MRLLGALLPIRCTFDLPPTSSYCCCSPGLHGTAHNESLDPDLCCFPFRGNFKGCPVVFWRATHLQHQLFEIIRLYPFLRHNAHGMHASHLNSPRVKAECPAPIKAPKHWEPKRGGTPVRDGDLGDWIGWGRVGGREEATHAAELLPNQVAASLLGSDI